MVRPTEEPDQIGAAHPIRSLFSTTFYVFKFLLQFLTAAPELTHGLAGRASEGRDLGGAKKEDDDQEDDYEFGSPR